MNSGEGSAVLCPLCRAPGFTGSTCRRCGASSSPSGDLPPSVTPETRAKAKPLAQPSLCPTCEGALQPWRITDESWLLRCTQCCVDWTRRAERAALERLATRQATMRAFQELDDTAKQELTRGLAEQQQSSASSSPPSPLSLFAFLGLPLPQYQRVKLPFLTLGLAAACLLSWLVLDQQQLAWAEEDGFSFSLLTATFAHADGWHLAGNLYFLLVFGIGAETAVPRRFLLPVMLGGSALGFLLEGLVHPGVQVLGISAAVSVVVGVAVVRFARVKVGLPIVGVFGVHGPMWLFGLVDIARQLYGVVADRPGVAFTAHLGGLVVGVIAGFCLPRH